MMIDLARADTLVAMPSDLSKMLGARLKKERKGRGYNQTQAAALHGCDQTRWSQLERGNASLEAIIEALALLGIPVAIVFPNDR